MPIIHVIVMECEECELLISSESSTLPPPRTPPRRWASASPPQKGIPTQVLCHLCRRGACRVGVPYRSAHTESGVAGLGGAGGSTGRGSRGIARRGEGGGKGSGATVAVLIALQ